MSARRTTNGGAKSSKIIANYTRVGIVVVNRMHRVIQSGHYSDMAISVAATHL